MTAALSAKSNGTQAALLVNGTEAVVFDAGGLVSGIKDLSIGASKLSGGQSGAPPVYGARAWCVFNGTLTGTNAPIAGGNVTSVTRTATGEYVVNFTTPMPSADYALVGTQGGTSGGIGVKTKDGTPPTVNSATISVFNTTFSSVDVARVSVAVFM